MKNPATIVLYIGITVLPLAAGFLYSLLYSFGLIGVVSNGFTWDSWKSLFSNASALYSIGYSVYLTLFSLLFIIGAALVFAWWQGSKRPKKWFFPVLFLPLCFPPLIAAFSWYYVLSPSGLFSRLFYALGFIHSIDQFPRLVNDNYGSAILISHVFLVFPLFTLLFLYQAKKERMDDLKNIAFTLGSSTNQFVWNVFIPLLLKKTNPLIILYGLFLFGAYEVPLILGQSSPRTVTVFITDKIAKYNLQDIPVGHAMAVVYTLFVIVVSRTLLKNKQLNLFE